MDISILLTQIAVMLLLILIGVICFRRGMITEAGSAQLSSFIMTFVMPSTIIHAFCRDYDPSMLGKLLLSFVLSALIVALSIVLSALLFPAGSPDYADKRMCVIFANNGFMALPLLQALYGDDGVFIGSVNIVVSNILLWTFGVWLLSRASGRASSINWRRIALNPGTLGFAAGMVLFLASLRLPAVLDNTVTFLADVNTPLAMIVLGIYLAQSRLLQTLRDRSVWLVCLARLLFIPMLSVLLFRLLPTDPDVAGVLAVSVATPCAVAASMFAQMCGTNYKYASRVIAFSTVLSAVTLPLMLELYRLVCG